VAGGSSAGGSGALARPEPLRLDPGALRLALLSIPKKAAGAGSGWLNETIRDLAFADGATGEEAFGLIHLLLQDIVQGAIPSTVADALGACVMTALDKGQPGDVRPIAMPECLRRAACRAISIQYGAQSSSHFSPLQYGVQTRDGLEQVQLQVRALLEKHPDWCVLRADCRNAFNTLSRKPILQQLREHFPELLPLVGQFYLSAGGLHFRGADGERTLLHSVTGVQQGDPLGPFLFALGIHPALRVVQQRWPGVHVLAYLDDVHLVGPQASVHGAFLELRRQFAAIGLSTRADKNHVWSPSERYAPVWSWPAADMGGVLPARISRGGYDVLGVPCCPAEQLAQRVLQRCMDPAAKGRPNFAHAEAALRGLATAEPKRGPQSALVLMRFCALPKVGYLLRALPPAATAPMAAAVDAAVRSFVAQLLAPDGPAHIAPDCWAASVLSLPIGHGFGGCGLPSAAAVAPLAHAGSLLATAPAVVARNRSAPPTPASIELEGMLGDMYAAARAAQPPSSPQEQQQPAAGAPQTNLPPPSPPSPRQAPQQPPAAATPLLPFQQTFLDLSTQISTELIHASEENPFTVELDAGPQPGMQHEFTRRRHAAQRRWLHARVAAEGSRADVIWAQDTCGYAAGAWQQQLPHSGRPKRLPGGALWFEGMRASDWRIALRRQLRLPFPALQALPGGLCPLCGHPCDAHGDHLDACELLRGLGTQAHHLVRNAIYVTAEEVRLQPTLEEPGLMRDRDGLATAERPADVYLAPHVPHGLRPPQPRQQRRAGGERRGGGAGGGAAAAGAGAAVASGVAGAETDAAAGAAYAVGAELGATAGAAPRAAEAAGTPRDAARRAPARRC